MGHDDNQGTLMILFISFKYSIFNSLPNILPAVFFQNCPKLYCLYTKFSDQVALADPRRNFRNFRSRTFYGCLYFTKLFSAYFTELVSRLFVFIGKEFRIKSWMNRRERSERNCTCITRPVTIKSCLSTREENGPNN